MNFGNLFFWGFIATIVLSVIMAASRPLGMSRLDLPFLLGTMVTPNRNKAPWIGFFMHLIMGWLFAMIYGVAFESTGWHTWWFGVIAGFVHSLAVLTVGLELMSFMHPRMANPAHGPTPTKQLQPPGFFARNYGSATALVTIVSHMIYGAILGYFYAGM